MRLYSTTYRMQQLLPHPLKPGLSLLLFPLNLGVLPNHTPPLSGYAPLTLHSNAIHPYA